MRADHADMTGTRANWFLQSIDDAEADPDDPFQMPVEEVGQRIDLRDPRGKLELRLQELMVRESRLYDRQVTCSIKDRPDTICSACPVSKAHDPGSVLGALCRIGRETEAVATELGVLLCQAPK